MATIGSVINGVQLKFGVGVDPELDASLLAALEQIIAPDLSASGAALELYISSISETTSAHSRTSRHYPPARKALDISRINGKRMSVFYPADALVQEVTKNLQERFEQQTPARRENFGPHLQKKLGAVFAPPSIVQAHRSHIHFSVN